jgi:hypothetical protein
MTTYYQIAECTDPAYEAGEIVARCEATSAKQARRIFGINERNEHLYMVLPWSRLAANLYDPKILRKTN